MKSDEFTRVEIDKAVKECSFLNKLIHFESIDSTNNYAKELADTGEQQGTVIVADKQTAGRGRMGRSWSSPKLAGLWFSLILRPDLNSDDLATLTPIVAVALSKTIEQLTKIKLGIKWPNDIYVGNKKICGILTEVSLDSDSVNYAVVGIGVNINVDRFNTELSDIATSLKIEDVNIENISRIDIIHKFLDEFAPLYNKLISGESMSDILNLYRKYSIILNRDIYIIKSGNKTLATAIDIIENGELLVRLEDGSLSTVNSGEVSIRTRK